MSEMDLLDGEHSALIKNSLHMHSPTYRPRHAQTHSLVHIHTESCVLDYFTLVVEHPPLCVQGRNSLLLQGHVLHQYHDLKVISSHMSLLKGDSWL